MDYTLLIDLLAGAIVLGVIVAVLAYLSKCALRAFRSNR